MRYITELSRELAALGHCVTIGCRPSSVLVEKARAIGVGVWDRFSFRGGLRPRAWARDLREYRRALAKLAPDIVHANLSQDHWTCALGNRMSGSPLCVVRTRHNTYPVANSFPNRVLNRNWTDYQIVVCDVVRRQLASQPIFDPARLCSIHNGVDAERFGPDAESRARAREEFRYGPNDLVLGIAARLVPAKGHEYLFRAAASLRAELPGLRVLVLGEGELERSLRDLAGELGIGSIVTFAGFREDMPYCTQAFDIGVQPSTDCDTSSFSLKEQMAAEKPVIASDYGGLTEIVTDPVEGLVVPQRTVEPLAHAVRALAKDAGLRATMGARGRARVLREFTVQVFASRTIEAYRRALQMHRARVQGRS